MPDIEQIRNKASSFSFEPSESLTEKANPFKLFWKAKEKLGPGGSAAAGGIIGGLGGYYGSKALTKMAISLMFANKSPEERARIMQSVQNNSKLNKIGAIIGALGGVYFGGARDLDFGDWDRFKQSLKDPEYWKKKENLESRTDRFKQRAADRWYTSKIASEVGGYTSSIIPISESLDLVQNDVFLDPYQKDKTSQLIYGAEDKDSGLTSGKQLTQSAIKAGIGFAPAYAFGKMTGGILGLPPPVRDRMSMVGGLAAAVVNSGVLDR